VRGSGLKLDIIEKCRVSQGVAPSPGARIDNPRQGCLTSFLVTGKRSW
jgi:hypothetical protein